MSERPGVPRDEFIDDIPFPETQGYVKKILGTAEDYRRLYGGGEAVSADEHLDATPAVSRRATPPVAKRASAKRASATTKKAVTPAKKAAAKKTTARKKKIG